MPAETPETRLALAALGAVDSANSLHGGAGARPSLAEIYAYASDPSYRAGPEFLQRLQSDPLLNADVRRLISNLSAYELPRAAAAASGQITRRESAGVLLTMTVSQARASQAYLGVTLQDEQAFKPSRLSFVGRNGAVVHLSLPDFDDAETQVIVEIDSPAFRMFADPETEVFLA